jgi:uncharacterized protein (TIGR02246 family)
MRKDSPKADSWGKTMPDPISPREGMAALRAVEAAWNDAAQPWNPTALAALYTEDAVFYGGRIGHSVGRAQVRAYFDSYAAIFTTVRLALVDQELRELAPGTILAQGTAAFDFAFQAGGGSSAKLRSTLVLVRRPEGWRILQHHFSPTPAEPPINAPA